MAIVLIFFTPMDASVTNEGYVHWTFLGARELWETPFNIPMRSFSALATFKSGSWSPVFLKLPKLPNTVPLCSHTGWKAEGTACNCFCPWISVTQQPWDHRVPSALGTAVAAAFPLPPISTRASLSNKLMKNGHLWTPRGWNLPLGLVVWQITWRGLYLLKHLFLLVHQFVSPRQIPSWSREVKFLPGAHYKKLQITGVSYSQPPPMAIITVFWKEDLFH